MHLTKIKLFLKHSSVKFIFYFNILNNKTDRINIYFDIICYMISFIPHIYILFEYTDLYCLVISIKVLSEKYE